MHTHTHANTQTQMQRQMQRHKTYLHTRMHTHMPTRTLKPTPAHTRTHTQMEINRVINTHTHTHLGNYHLLIITSHHRNTCSWTATSASQGSPTVTHHTPIPPARGEPLWAAVPLSGARDQLVGWGGHRVDSPLIGRRKWKAVLQLRPEPQMALFWVFSSSCFCQRNKVEAYWRLHLVECYGSPEMLCNHICNLNVIQNLVRYYKYAAHFGLPTFLLLLISIIWSQYVIRPYYNTIENTVV